ncbi:HTH-type transcriptional regulatory protein GabR [compost metagenome]
MQAYELLHAEGYLVMKKGAGTFIATNAAAHSPVGLREEKIEPALYDFRHGVPSWDAFPMDRWQKAFQDACRMATPEILGYGPAEGSEALRQEIARLLRSTRSIPAVPERIIITAGATQAIDIISRLFLQRGHQVIVEDPSHTVLRGIFSFSGGEVISVPVDEEGLCVQDIENSIAEQSGGKAAVKLIYVTPSHQFPAGMTMSQQRRAELLDYARQKEAYIIEDDYDSEYRYIGQKTTALAGLDSSDRVIYVGSFSKSLFPALRIGYVVLPASLIESFLAIKCITSRMTPALEQEALARFIRSGQYARHVNQMSKLYSGRRSCLVQSLAQCFQDRARTYGDEAGLHLLIQLKTPVKEEAIADKAIQSGLKIYPARDYFVASKPESASFLLGYANLTEHQIRTGIELFAEAEECCRREKGLL